MIKDEMLKKQIEATLTINWDNLEAERRTKRLRNKLILVIYGEILENYIYTMMNNDDNDETPEPLQLFTTYNNIWNTLEMEKLCPITVTANPTHS